MHNRRYKRRPGISSGSEKGGHGIATPARHIAAPNLASDANHLRGRVNEMTWRMKRPERQRLHSQKLYLRRRLADFP